MSIVLIAVMLDRPALTMRNVALAALAILLVAPDSLFDPSFEMSFAAVIALVAVYEWLSQRGRQGCPMSVRSGLRCAEARAYGWRRRHHAGGRHGRRAVCVYHFHRMTHYGLIANLVAAPPGQPLIMPMALLSLLAMPFGLEAGR